MTKSADLLVVIDYLIGPLSVCYDTTGRVTLNSVEFEKIVNIVYFGLSYLDYRDTLELRIFWVFPANPGVQINFYS